MQASGRLSKKPGNHSVGVAPTRVGLFTTQDRADTLPMKLPLKRILFIAWAMFALGSSLAMADFLYVDGNDSDCSDSGPGSLAEPYCTIDKAAENVSAGDTVTVFGGTYFDHVEITASGTSSNPITFQPAAGQIVTVRDQFRGFGVTDSNWVVIDGVAHGELAEYKADKVNRTLGVLGLHTIASGFGCPSRQKAPVFCTNSRLRSVYESDRNRQTGPEFRCTRKAALPLGTKSPCAAMRV